MLWYLYRNSMNISLSRGRVRKISFSIIFLNQNSKEKEMQSIINKCQARRERVGEDHKEDHKPSLFPMHPSRKPALTTCCHAAPSLGHQGAPCQRPGTWLGLRACACARTAQQPLASPHSTQLAGIACLQCCCCARARLGLTPYIYARKALNAMWLALPAMMQAGCQLRLSCALGCGSLALHARLAQLASSAMLSLRPSLALGQWLWLSMQVTLGINWLGQYDARIYRLILPSRHLINPTRLVTLGLDTSILISDVYAKNIRVTH